MSKGFGEVPEKKFVNLKHEVKKRVKKLRKFMKRPLVQADLLDNDAES